MPTMSTGARVRAYRARASIDSRRNVCVRREVNQGLEKGFRAFESELEVNSNLRGDVAGRVIVGAITYTGPFAIAGDVGYYIQQGARVDQAIIRGIIGSGP